MGKRKNRGWKKVMKNKLGLSFAKLNSSLVRVVNRAENEVETSYQPGQVVVAVGTGLVKINAQPALTETKFRLF